MLVFWTAAKVANVRQTIGRTLGSFKPVPAHRFVEYEEGEVVEAKPGEIVVACGTKPVDALKKAGVLPKNRGVNKLRGQPFQTSLDKGTYMVSFDPGLVDREPDKKAEMDWDVRLANRYQTTGSLEPLVGTYEWVDDFSDLIAKIEAKHAKTGKPVDVSTDTETMGFYPWYADKHIVCIGFTMAGGEAQAVYTVRQKGITLFEDAVTGTPLHDQIRWLLTSPKVKLKLANGKFDLVWIKQKWGIACSNFKFDTLLVGSLLDENRSNSLNGHAKTYTDMGGYDDSFNSKHDKGHMERIPKDDLLPYIGGDVDATHRTSEVLKTQLLNDPELANFYVKLLHPAARAFEKLESRGVVVNAHKYETLGEDLRIEIARLQKDALALMPRRLRIKHDEKISSQIEAGKSPLTPAILKDFFFGPRGLNLTPKMTTEKTGEPSTTKAHLQMFADNEDAAAMCGVLEELNAAEKTLSTFVTGFLKHLRPDGRFHPSYMLFHGGYQGNDDDSGTVTGRLSAKDPAIQTLPKKTRWAKRLRECYEAPPGKVVFQCVAPDTRLWTADLKWVRAEDVKEGDELFGFDEHGHGKHRKMQTSVVEKVVRQVVRRMKVTLDDGTEIVCSSNHKWLGYRGSINTWRSTYRLKPGDQLRRVSRVVQPEETYEAGWLAGYLEGEGWMSGRHGDGWSLGVGQKEGPTHQRAKANFAKMGYEFCESKNGSGLQTLRMLSTWQVFDCLQRTRPERLIDKRTWEGFALPRHGAAKQMCRATVVSVEEVEDGDVISIQTSTRTFVAEGIASHNCDFSQGELRVVACVAPESKMIAAYREGFDLHSITASSMAGMSLDDFMALKTADPALFNKLRTNGKAGNFGLLYGMSPEGFVAYAWANYGVKLTVEEATQLREAFLYDSWPGLPKYHDRIKGFAKQYGHVRSPLGRVRHLPHIYSRDGFTRSGAERQAINSPIQSTLSDMMLLAIAMVEDAFPGGEVEMVGMIHDSVFGYVPEENAAWWVEQVVNIMSNLPLTDLFGWKPQLLFPADGEMGPNLAQLKELEFDKVAA